MKPHPQTGPAVPADVIDAAVRLAESRQWDVDAVLVDVGISPLLLRKGPLRLSEDQVVRLVQYVWNLTDDELLGISPHRLPRGTFRLLCYALLGASDLQDALDRLEGFLRAIPAIPLRIVHDESPGMFAIVLAIAPQDEISRLGVAIGLGTVSRVLAWMLRSNVTPLRVELPYPRPADLAVHRVMLDGPITFNATRAAVVVSDDWLTAPLMRDERDIDEFVASSPRALISPPRYQRTTCAQVRRLLETGMSRGSVPSVDDLAHRLAMSPQTLRRRLSEEGTSARQLSQDVRREIAVEALT
ncbi:MAG: AraC family transcriptional regulator ligand-binding domain-containing protein, partial [Marmoricola sp.]